MCGRPPSNHCGEPALLSTLGGGKPSPARGAALCLGVTVGCGRVGWAAALCAELWGEAQLAELLLASVLRTLALVLVFGMLRYLVRGGLEWVTRSAVSRHAALLGRNTALVVQRLAWLGDVLIGVVILSGLLSVHATIGSQQITIGLVLLAVAALGVSSLASWMLQTLLTEHVLARRHVDTGVSTSVSRLLHYALVSVGCVLALVVLGVDLTTMTLLVSVLGVGIGFGLQTTDRLDRTVLPIQEAQGDEGEGNRYCIPVIPG